MKGQRGNPGWQKGQSGNPAGTSKLHWLVKKAAQAEGIKCIEELVKLRDQEVFPRLKLAAAVELLDRGFGKPETTVFVGDAAAPPMEDLSDAELHEIARNGGADPAEETGGAVEPRGVH